ncbi:MAG TPA: molybdenum ABC transporter ATP-binding protein [Terriglobales bacterium]|jgi:molybdate transport system ATP-binding protein|nr:molybdenum ABC transporter ATP-binding protein [Terriglobales bacterium]
MLLRCRIPLANFELDIDVSFESRITAIFGPSGSGKTTLLDAIAGLRPIADGEITLDGRTLFSSSRRISLPPQQRGIGYVPQEGALFPHLSVRKNILFGAERGTSAAAPIEIEHVLTVLDIGHLLDRPITTLSGGEGQRVALARAILSRPELLLLDEPLAALDVGLKEKILPYLGRVRDEFRIPMIYVTHNLTEVLTLADWVLMIKQGHLITQGIPRQTLRSSHAMLEIPEGEFENVFTVTLVESDTHAGHSRVRLQSGEHLFIPYVERPSDRPLQIRISADDIIIATTNPAGISASNVLPGTVRSIDLVDGQALLTVLAGEEFYIRITAGAVARLGLAQNGRVFLIMKTRSFHLL